MFFEILHHTQKSDCAVFFAEVASVGVSVDYYCFLCVFFAFYDGVERLRVGVFERTREFESCALFRFCGFEHRLSVLFVYPNHRHFEVVKDKVEHLPFNHFVRHIFPNANHTFHARQLRSPEGEQSFDERRTDRASVTLFDFEVARQGFALVKSDYEYGLTDDEIGLYLNKSYDIEQMKVLSKCLHKGVSEELLTLLKDSRMAAPKMQTALDYYEKGVPIDAIREVVQKDDTAVNMRRMFDVVLEKLNKAKEQMPQDLEYVKSLVAQMDEVVAKINHQNERYDALNKKLSEIETSKDDEEVRERLVKENQDKDALINSQQNELNKASSTIARLRDDIEKKDKEMKRMGDRIESLEDKIISVATENKKEAESKAEPQESQSVSQADKKMVDTVAVPQNMQAVANGIPVYYQIPVVDGTGNVVQRLPIERSVRKSSNSGVASLFARLSFKKKSRADIVKLVASGDLVPAQLVQIKSAIEKGLTESQLVELINNNISAEKMKEIIEIAVLENSMAD